MVSTTKNENFAKAMKDNDRWPLDKAVKWIRDNMSPAEVFDIDQLDEWSSENGWVSDDVVSYFENEHE